MQFESQHANIYTAMTDKPDQSSNQREAERQGRLRKALRENLKRRKSQSRGRTVLQAAPASPDGPSTESPQDDNT